MNPYWIKNPFICIMIYYEYIKIISIKEALGIK